MDDFVRVETDLIKIVDGDPRQQRYTRIILKETDDALNVNYNELKSLREALLTIMPREVEGLRYRPSDGVAPLCAAYMLAMHGDVDDRLNYARVLTEYFLLLASKGYSGGTPEGVSKDYALKVGIGYHTIWRGVHWIFTAAEAASLNERDLAPLYDMFKLVRDDAGDNMTAAEYESYRHAQITGIDLGGKN